MSRKLKTACVLAAIAGVLLTGNAQAACPGSCRSLKAIVVRDGRQIHWSLRKIALRERHVEVRLSRIAQIEATIPGAKEPAQLQKQARITALQAKNATDVAEIAQLRREIASWEAEIKEREAEIKAQAAQPRRAN